MSTPDNHTFSLKEVRLYNIRLLILYLSIRYKVFIKEYQRKITDEFCLKDIKAKHYIFSIGIKHLGIVRILYRSNVAELGRMAIIKGYRNSGYGSEFINQIIGNIRDNCKVELISLYTLDNSLISFYKKFGFIENGEVFFDNLPYMNMIKSFKR